MCARMKTLLITGTDTGVGKTWVSCLLLHQLRNHGVRVGAYKPVCSGGTADSTGRLRWTDVEALVTACGEDVPEDRVCPQRFLAPLAPAIAAQREGRRVDEERLHSGLEEWRGLADVVIVEGAGGLLCPLSDSVTVADLAQRLAAPIVIVAANRLGVVNHTLLTLDVARHRSLDVRAVVLNDVALMTQSASMDRPHSDLSVESNQQLLCEWVPDLPVFRCHLNHTTLEPCNDAARKRSIV